MDEYDELFMGQLEAVKREFNQMMGYYNQEIEDATKRIKTLLSDESLGEDGKIDSKKKKSRDYSILAERKHIGALLDKKVDILIKMGQFAKNDQRWDAEEALSVSIQAFLRVAKGAVTPNQYKKLSKAISDTLVNKTVSELKEFVNNTVKS